jgi:5'-3' exonuclease
MKLNLVIDASGIFYRSLFTLGNYGLKKDQRLLESEESKGIFMRKLATDFSALVRSVENVNRVIVCLDSSSWRKKIEIEGGGYKASRKKDESTIDWDSFFSITREFSEILESKGYIISKVQEAEADDLLFLWSRKLNALGESVIMVTGDRDLHQVVALQENGSWTVSLDPVSQRRKIVMTQATYDTCKNVSEAENVDLFDPSTWSSSPGDIISSLVDKNDVEVIDPVNLATRKVLLGDNGDAVPGIVTWQDPKDPTKTRSLTDNKLSKALVNLPSMTWRSLLEGTHLEALARELSIVSKLTLDAEKLIKTIQRNVKLVVLDEEIIPVEIQENFKRLFAQLESSSVNLTREAILEGTKWWIGKESFVPKSYEFSMEVKEDLFTEEKNTEKSSAEAEALNKAIQDIKNISAKKNSALF